LYYRYFLFLTFLYQPQSSEYSLSVSNYSSLTYSHSFTDRYLLFIPIYFRDTFKILLSMHSKVFLKLPAKFNNNWLMTFMLNLGATLSPSCRTFTET